MDEGPRRVIVFSHANGFPAGTYRALFDAWHAEGYAVHAIEKYGHDPRFPVTRRWPHLRAQLIDFCEREVGGPAYLVGHSLGGYLSLMAALRRPDLASGLVMLDSPLLYGWKARAVQWAQALGLAERLSPGKVSKRRRQHWDSAEVAYAHFAAKPAFARWAPGILHDYIACGTENHGGGGLRLSFEREVETAIYNGLPHHLAGIARRHPLQCDVAFVRGSRSAEVRQVGLRATEQLGMAHGARRGMAIVEGSHLFPLERPAETAATVLSLIEGMRGGQAPRL